jgi:transposase InsO family protein
MRVTGLRDHGRAGLSRVGLSPVGCHGQRRRARTTVADPAAAPASDRVERAFAPVAIGAPDRQWLADITYCQTDEGWLDGAAVLDGSSRAVVGWAMTEHLRTELVIDALAMAVTRRQPRAGLVHHSDRGVQACRAPS